MRVEPGYELALAAALGGRLDAALVADMAARPRRCSTAPGPDGATALLAPRWRLLTAREMTPGAPPAARARGR